jgi:hypothetical protein
MADFEAHIGPRPMLQGVSVHGRYGKQKLNKIACLPAIKLFRL